MNKSKINMLIAGSDADETQLLVKILLEIIPEFKYGQQKMASNVLML
ncbi:MAG: hypothetical protein ACR2KZ_00915 [Segetibacter sp.]